MTDWDKIFDELAEANRKAYDSVDHEKLKAKSAEEFERGVRLGWWDADGNPITQETDSDDENEDDDA